MADILIRRCTIKIVRHGGWAWGTAPRSLLDRALTHLPDLIGAEVERLWPGGEERDILAPIRLRVAVSLAELRAGATPAGSDDPGHAASHSGFAEKLGAALRLALAQELNGASEDAAATHETIESNSPAGSWAKETIAPADPLGVLLAWLRKGRLHVRLASFAIDALTAWHTHILSLPAAAPLDDAATADLAARLAERLAARPPGICESPAAALRLRLEVFAVLESTMEGALGSPVIRETIGRGLPYRGFARTSPGDGESAASISGPATRAALLPGPRPLAVRAALYSRAGAAPPGARAVPRERRIECALPFLILGPLARLGYFGVLDAVLAAARLPEAMPAFALALAYKALDPPARGWLRSPAVREAAAACAMLADAPEDSAIASLGAAIAAQLSPLDALVEDLLCEGHRPGSPFLLSRAGSGRESLHVVWDTDGLFPVAAAIDPVPVLGRMPKELVLVPAGAADPDRFAALHAAGVRFVTDARPCRGESWRSIAGRPGARWRSNDMLTAEDRLAAAGRRLDEAFELAEETWKALAVDRPALHRRTAEAFDRSLTLASSLALGTIAWQLWGGRESTAPALALSRFHTLQARVCCDSERVSVLLPLGSRFMDLRDNGLLDDVAGIPWFGGRRLVFGLG